MLTSVVLSGKLFYNDFMEWLQVKRVNPHFWDSKDNCIRYLNWLASIKSFVTSEDWRGLRANDFRQNRGMGLLKRYNNSPFKLLAQLKPDIICYPWLFKNSINWTDRQNKLDYLKYLGEIKGFSSYEDWYSIIWDDFKNNYGSGFIGLYYNSPIRALKDCIPEYDWQDFKFKCTSKNYWKSISNCQTYLSWLAQVMNYTNFDDWYQVTAKTFKANHGYQLLKMFNYSPSKIICSCFPDHHWHIDRFYDGRKRQKLLFSIVKSIFPLYKVIWDHWHPHLRFSKTNRPMQFDIFVPEINLAFEYQGEGHFHIMKHWGGASALELIEGHDAQKEKACHAHNIKLIAINYDWDGKKQSVLNRLLSAGFNPK